MAGEFELVNQQATSFAKTLLELAQIFARKSRRPANSLSCLDLLNAMETMQISPRTPTDSTTTKVKKTVYYLRHFEALHNIRPYNYQLVDPRLSPLGESQAAKTNEMLLTFPPVDLIVCSPLSRTLQTYLLTIDHLVRSAKFAEIPLIIHPDLQEVCSVPCDVGRPVEELKRDFPSLNEPLDAFRQAFGDEQWREKHQRESFYHPDRIDERARKIRQWLIDRPEERILVISHNLMIQALFRLDGEEADMSNGEIRIKEYST